MKNLAIIVGSLLFLVFGAGCDAPRNNPVESIPDPPKTYTIEGITSSMHSVPIPLKDVIVSWEKRKSCITDGNGFFTIPYISNTTGWLYFFKNGYESDSLRISFGEEDTISVNRQINLLAWTEGISFTSNVITEHPDRTYGSLNFSTKLYDDVYSDILTVTLENSSIGFSKTLVAKGDNVYECIINETDLSVAKIDALIGKDFSIIARYNSGKTQVTGTAKVERIIKGDIEYISPANNQNIVSANPILKWERNEPGFNFTYSAEIYTNEITPVLVWQSQSIPMQEISKRVDSPLQNGSYFWVIWVVDEYGNKLRSKPASFIVELAN